MVEALSGVKVDVYMYVSTLFRNLRFLQKALHFLGIPRKRTMGSALFRNLRFLGIPRTLALAQVGAAISTVEMAAPTWARARARARARMGTVEMATPT